MGLSCQRSDAQSIESGSTQASSPGQTYDLIFDDVKSFLQEYRANLQRDRLWAPVPDELSVSDIVTIRLKPPFFKQRIVVDAKVIERRSGGYDLMVTSLTPRHKATLEAYSGLCESIWEECMRHLVDQVGGSLMGIRSNPSSGASQASMPPRAGSLTSTTSLVSPPPSMITSTTTLSAVMSPVSYESPSTPIAAGGMGSSIDSLEPEAAAHAHDEGDPHAGLLERPPFENTLARLALEQVTGAVSVAGASEPMSLTLSRGWLLCVRAPGIEARTRLGEILVKTGVISEGIRDAALATATQRAVPLGEALVQSRRVSPQALRQALERQLKTRLVLVSRVRDGHWTFAQEGVEAKGSTPPVNVARTFYDRWVRAFTKRTPHEVGIAERKASGHLMPSARAAANLSLLALEQGERDLFDVISAKSMQLQDVYHASPISRRQTHAVVFALVELGLLEFGELAA